MLDFGKHTIAIWSAYGVTITLLAALILLSWRRSRRVKATLDKLEAKRNG